MPLTPRQLEYGFHYYFREDWDEIDAVVAVSEYRNQKRLVINCTQLSGKAAQQYATATAKKRLVSEWCDLLRENPQRFTQLAFGTRMPQELLDAVGHQVNLQRLDIKWGVYKNLAPLANLQKLKLLTIGSGAGVQSIAPLTELPRLMGLAIENFQKISDYSPLAQLQNLESLSIEGDGMGPQYIRIQSLAFLEHMPKLRYLALHTYRLQKKDYGPLLKLRKLEHLTLPANREVKACYEQLVELPKLKWGMLKTQPKLYTS